MQVIEHGVDLSKGELLWQLNTIEVGLCGFSGERIERGIRSGKDIKFVNQAGPGDLCKVVLGPKLSVGQVVVRLG